MEESKSNTIMNSNYEDYFSSNQSHKKHVKVKKFQCNFCEKSFRKSGNLMNHIETNHEGQRKYKCDSCGKSFGQLGNL